MYPNRVPRVRIPPSPPPIMPDIMSYQVLALKYRPLKFDEVVGQSHVTTTLANAISSDRVAHAILFTGPRGTGKTTIARILARAVNCAGRSGSEPCNECKICRDIIEGHCTDVFEIDGASNNSVDQIREIRENVTYMPSAARFKIYIIDEVHMLSNAAFNALLKTLEEPPAHVMFIFATTEVHKLPATILSRCQRHDLGRISLPLISGHLKKLCSMENFELEPRTLDIVAKEADGSIRDGLSLLDRILSAAGTKKIDHQTVLDILGTLDTKIMHEVSNAIFEKNCSRLIDIVDEIHGSGLDMKKFYADLIIHFRNMNIIKHCGTDTKAIDLPRDEKQEISLAVEKFSGHFLTRILHLLLEGESMIRYSAHTRTAIETVLLNLTELNPGACIEQIIKKLDILKTRFSTQSDGTAHPAATAQTGPSAIQAQNKDTRHTDDCEQETRDVSSKVPEKTWQNFLNQVSRTVPSAATLIARAKITKETQDEITIELKNCSSYEKKRLETKKEQIETICRESFGKKLNMRLISANKPAPTPPQDGGNDMKSRQEALYHPLVVDTQKIFNAQIIKY